MNTPDPQAELRKELKIFQDYTASYGYPLNNHNHSYGLDIALERISHLITAHTNNLIAEIESKLPKPDNFGNGIDDLVHLDEVKAILATYKGKESEK